jgi:hypothetical protein
VKLFFRNLAILAWNLDHDLAVRKEYLEYQVPKSVVIDPIPIGATEDWSPSQTTQDMGDFVLEAQVVAILEEHLVVLADVDMEEVYAEDIHRSLLAMEHAALTDFNVGLNRALYRFNMTPSEMLGAAVMHEGSGEHELVPV